jgi:YYY domain-containing protein
MRDVLAWVATVEILGLASLPLLRAFFRNRRDAALLSRPLGLALAAYGGWAFTVFLWGSFDRAILLAAVAALGVVSYFVYQRGVSGSPRESLWGPDEKLAAILFWSSTAVFLIIRAAFPEILGQEKFMDLAFLNSLTRNAAMPPADPWMAGRSINYYYWGYLLAAALAKVSTVTTFVSYNLLIATFAGYSFVAAACLGLRLSGGRLAAGVWAGVATVFAGNLAGALDAWNAPLGKGFDYWHASRVIASGDTINEFPFFTFFQADLHPHLLAFPFFIAAFAVAHRFIERGPWRAPGETWTKGTLLGAIGGALLVTGAAGTAYAANNWNLPAMGILLVFAGIFQPGKGERLPTIQEAFRGALLGVALLVATRLLWKPYWLSYRLPEAQVLRATQASALLEFLGVWGLLFAAAIAGLWPRPAANEQADHRGKLFLAATAAGSLLVALLAQRPALCVVVFLGGIALRAARRRLQGREGSPDPFALFLLLLSLAVIGGCEFVYFKDSYGDKLQRMNTIFKFYHQAWPLLAIAAAVFAERAWRESTHRRVLRIALATTAALALLYPFDAFLSRLRQLEGGFSLDARAALVRRNPGDAAAIEWLQKHAPRGRVVMEATGDPYSEYSRISTHTGIPAVLGWGNHEGLWRSNDPEVAERAGQIRTFYGASDLSLAIKTLQTYHVNYVVVGDLERQTYPSVSAVESFPFLTPVLRGGTTIYRVFGTQ